MASVCKSIVAFLGDELLSGKEKVATATALAGTDVVALYFSAHWCGPCRGFTPKLVTTLEQLKEDNKSVEVVFVSADQDEASFTAYFGEMDDFHALPFADRARKEALEKKFKVGGYPTVVLIDGKTGKAYNTDARGDIMNDPMGKKFPWKPPTLAEALGETLVNGKGEAVAVSSLMAGTFGIYFSAHWCPPCKGFTPQLAETYATLKAANKDFEVVFVSSDRDEAAFDSYFGEMPWLALPYKERERKEQLSALFKVQGIPTLVVLGPGGVVINAKGRHAVGLDPKGAEFPWEPKLVNSVESPDGINETASLIVFMEDAVEGVKAALQTAVEAIGEAARPTKGEDAEMLFFTAKANGEMSGRIRGMCGLSVEGESKSVAVVLLDISDNGGYYVLEGDTVDAASIKQFLADYETKGKLTRKQFASG